MKITTKQDYTKLETAQEIFEHLRSTRDLEIDPKLPQLPELVKAFGLSQDNLKTAKDLINSCIQAGQDILIFGDYDADGITATAVLWTTLMSLAKGSKARILPFIPDRIRHGYGLSTRALADIYSGQAFEGSAYPDFSPKLLITVDNGIVANEEIEDLRTHRITTIITDHHQPSSNLPKADLLLHSTISSGSGLAWVISLYLTDSAPSVLELLSIATIGIVADQLPLTGINRTLVTHGLPLLSSSKNPGIRALATLANIKDQSFSTYHINYQLAPRLNAAGRLASATDALRLLCTQDPTAAKQLAALINAHNQERQALTEVGIEQALKDKPEHNLIISASSDYHEGVIGLIAGRLAERYQRPAIAISIGDEFSKGSARSLKGIDITKILREFSADFEGLGGHKLAAGFSVKSDKLEDLTHKLETYADEQISDDLLIPEFTADALLTLDQSSLELAHLLTTLAPFGLGNPKPRFLSQDLKVVEDRPLGDGGKHHRLTLEQNGVTREAIWFNAPISSSESLSSIKELIYNIDVNVWRERESLQLVVKHANI